MNGEVVGINKAIIAHGQGIGFAIPIDMATKIVAPLKENGEVTREGGVVVVGVRPESTAAKAGVQQGDVILC
jgi:serine protease Do